MSNRLSILFIIICFLAMPSFAVQVKGLYQATVPVPSQSASLRSNAVKDAFKQVLVKVSGDSSVLNVPTISDAITKASNYLQAYNYQDSDQNGSPELLLQTQFDKNAVRKLLVNNQQSLWGRNRPLILVWFAMAQMNQTPQIISNAMNTPAKIDLEQQASNRGIPVLFPMLDLTDMQDINVNDLWNSNSNTILQSSKRYGADAILVVKVKQSNEKLWTANWQLLSMGTTTRWNNQAADLKTLIDKGMNNVVDGIAAKYAVIENNEANNNIELTIVNIQDISQYAKLSNYLQSLTPVQQVEVEQVNPSSIKFLLQVSGGAFALKQALSLDHRLKPLVDLNSNDNNSEIKTNTNSGLVYQWQP